MTETFQWANVRLELVNGFGDDYPTPRQEERILEAFTEHPQAVISAGRRLTERRKNGKARNPWQLLMLDAETILEKAPEVKADAGHAREVAVRNAEAWIRNAGVYVDREGELLAELY